MYSCMHYNYNTQPHEEPYVAGLLFSHLYDYEGKYS